MTAQTTNDHDLLIEIKTMLAGVLSRDADKETRLRALERKVYIATGASGAIGAVVGWAMQLLGQR